MVDVMSRNRAVVTLPTDTQILIERDFAAPTHLVYTALTTAERGSTWWGGQRGEMTLCEIDLRVGRRWLNVMIAHGKFEVAFHGVYRDNVPNERLVSTEVYDAIPDADRSTELLPLISFPSRERPALDASSDDSDCRGKSFGVGRIGFRTRVPIDFRRCIIRLG